MKKKTERNNKKIEKSEQNNNQLTLVQNRKSS